MTIISKMILNFLKSSYSFFYHLIASSFLLGKDFKTKEEFINIDFDSLFWSCVRSKLAYVKFTDLLDIWKEAQGTYDQDPINICLRRIKEEPIFYNDCTTSAQGFIMQDKDNKVLYLNFRGTDDLRDFCTDLDERGVDISEDILVEGASVHNGFLTQYKSLENKIITDIKSADIDTIYLCGHSLGGALATIASIYLQKVFKDKVIVLHTFGSPRVGNANFSKAIEERIHQYYRVVNEVDPITQYPFTSCYTHIGNCLTITSKGKIRLTQNDTPWYQRILQVVLHIDLMDHAYDNYMANLRLFHSGL